MNTNTFEIVPEQEIKPDEYKKFVKLSFGQNKLLSVMNRRQRRKYYKDHKSEFISWRDLTIKGELKQMRGEK